MITQERLKELIEYNPETGEFKRKKRKGKCNALSSNGSITIGIQRENHYAQRLAFLYMEGYLPENDVVHLNGDKQDNRWCNLREASRACTAKFAGIQRNNTSGVVGVYLHKSGKYAAQIFTNKRTYFLGLFVDFIS